MLAVSPPPLGAILKKKNMHFMIIVPINVREAFVITKSRYFAFIDKTNIMADYGRLILYSKMLA